MEKTLRIHIKELREQIAQYIEEDYCYEGDPSACPGVNHCRIIQKAANKARGKKSD